MDGLIQNHGGRIANTAGDSVLAEFPSAVDAVQCAVAVQEKLAEASAGDLSEACSFSTGGVQRVWRSGGSLIPEAQSSLIKQEALPEC
jgi:adenylate cyclase